MRFELAVCLRYLAPKRGRLFVSVSTLFSILGLAVGVATYITVIAVMTGFRNQITDGYTGFYSDLIAYKEKVERGHRVFAVVTERDLAVIEQAAAETDGIEATSPFIYGKVSLHVDSLAYAFDLRGVDPEREPKVSTILAENKLLEGDFKFERDGDYVAIVIGKQIADVADLTLDESLVIASSGAGTLGQQSTSLNAYVAGIFAYGNAEQDLSVYTSIETAQILQSLGGNVHRVSIKLEDPERADEIKPRLAAKIEALRRRDRLPEYHRALEQAVEQLDASVAPAAEAPATLRGKASQAELDEDQLKRLDALIASLEELPDGFAEAKGPIAAALALGRDFPLDRTDPLEAARDAAAQLGRRLLAVAMQIAGLTATLDETDPLRAELAATAETLTTVESAMQRAHFECDEMLFDPFGVVTWSELNPDLFSLVNQEKIITAIFVAMIVVVAGFIIVSSLSMTVVQKKREIGILRAMGARSSSVATIFGLGGFVVGLIGTGLGSLLGLLISYNFNPIRDWVGDVLGFRLFTPYATIPISVQLTDLVIIWCFTMVWSVLASIVPAVSAARLRPAEALRWE